MLRMTRHRALALAAALFGLVGCGKQEFTNVVLISIDTIRADHMSVYGYERPTTPHLERLAESSVAFDAAYATSSTTGPSHATLFTGLYAPRHGVNANAVALGETHVTLAEVLREHGFDTAGIIGSFVLDGRFGFAQGFDVFQQDFDLGGGKFKATHWEGIRLKEGFDRRASDTTARALTWLESARDTSKPFFLFLHYFDPHEPYVPPEPYRSSFVQDESDAVQNYDAEIAYTDAQIGRFLDALDAMGLRQQTLVIVTSDHGQGLGQHNELYHAVNIYEESVRAPLLMGGPGIVVPQRRAELFEQVDVLPTVLGLLGIESPAGVDGEDLSALLRNEAPAAHPSAAFVYRQYYPRRHQVRGARVGGEQFGVRQEHWKLIDGPGGTELYDLATDPHELTNVYAAEPIVGTRLREALEAWRARLHVPASTPVALDESERAKLRALGY